MNPAMCLFVLFMAMTVLAKLSPPSPDSKVVKVILPFLVTMAVSPFIIIFYFIIFALINWIVT